MKITTIKLNRKRMREKNGNSDGFCFYRKNADRYYIVLRHHPSTKTRLHELSHVFREEPKTSLETNYIKSSDYLRQELGADIFAYEKCSKDLSLEALLNIAHELIVYKNRPNWIFKTFLKELAIRGYKLNKQDKSTFWQAILSEYKTRKE